MAMVLGFALFVSEPYRDQYLWKKFEATDDDDEANIKSLMKLSSWCDIMRLIKMLA